MTTPKTTTEIPKTRSVPVWLAVLLILLCACGGGYLAYRFLLGGSNEKIVVLERSADETIQQDRRNPNIWWMQTTSGGDANARITFDTSRPNPPEMHYAIIRNDLTHDQNVLVYLDARARWAFSLNLTNDQLTKLEKVPSAHVDLPKPTSDAIHDGFSQWEKLPAGQAKERLEDKLFSLLEDGTKAKDADSRAAALTRVENVRAILTPAQLKQVPNIRLPWRG